jgi:hypothetical protein
VGDEVVVGRAAPRQHAWVVGGLVEMALDDGLEEQRPERDEEHLERAPHLVGVGAEPFRAFEERQTVLHPFEQVVENGHLPRCRRRPGTEQLDDFQVARIEALVLLTCCAGAPQETS